MEAKATIKYNGNQFTVTVSGHREDVAETLIAISQSGLLKSFVSNELTLTEGQMKQITKL